VAIDIERGGNRGSNNAVIGITLAIAKDEENISPCETPKSGNNGNSEAKDIERGGNSDGESGAIVVTVTKGEEEKGVNIKNVIKSYEETINDKRPIEGRDKQPFINWYFKQNGNSISASELWEIVVKEKAFTPETKPAWQIQPEQSTITVEVCGEISEVVVE
jgi:hypothetical protein